MVEHYMALTGSGTACRKSNQEGSSSFLKKRTKKLLRSLVRVV
jgi:hypothetical protein